MSKEIYNSIFQQEIRDLIELKRALGFSYESEAGSLRCIDTFLCRNTLSEKSITKELCDLGCKKRTHKTVTNQASRISIMRVFCRYLNDIGIPAYIPPKGITKNEQGMMHIFIQMRNFRAFLMQLIKAGLCLIPIHTAVMLCRSFSESSTPVECMFRNCVLPKCVMSISKKDISMSSRPKP